MSKLTLWKFEQFDIRMVDVNGDPWFIGVDVAKALGYKNPRKAIQDHVSMNDKGVTKYDTPGGAQGLIMISESGLYSLILACKMPSAVRFKNWVTSEVLPSVRKTGSYTLTGSVTQDNIQSVLSALNALEVKFNQYQNMLSQVCGKLGIHECLKVDSIVDDTMSLISDDCTCSSRSVDVLEFSRNLKSLDLFLGRTSLFAWLRYHNYVSSKPDSWNKPTYKYLKLKYFELKGTPSNPNVLKLYITPAGQEHLIQRLSEELN